MKRSVLSALITAILVVPLLPIGSATAYEPGDPAFERTWERTDRPVAEGLADRTWMWGPQGHSAPMMEAYNDAPGEERLVQYFDKSRMEINDPAGDPDSTWYVTNGLLASELITGDMQVGDDEFIAHEPADVHLAGDAHPDSPTYATFNDVLDEDATPEGTTLTQTINQAGDITVDEAMSAHGVTAGHYVEDTDHTVASVFWTFMNSEGLIHEAGQTQTDHLFEDPFFAVGFPITDAYWMHVPVAGAWQDVLTQCFERRCLTYTPANDEGWQVEAANIGQHYYEWRYDDAPADPPPPDDPPGEPPTEPVSSYSGSGDDVVNIEKPDGPGEPAVAFIRGNAESRHFAVTAYSPEGEYNTLLVNTTDPYEGLVPLDFQDEETAQFEISATGEWEIELRPIESLDQHGVPGEVHGAGDHVFRIAGTSETAYVEGNHAERHFAVIGHGDRWHLLVNTTDAYDGRVRVPADVQFIEITGTGDWSIVFE